ncbi:MAG: phosphonate C-P lyase system protein PhnG [Chloroflexi bacterium]|jgi:alpha-D-ribose 1-methylphosphonate 5-triphosphate synthase subunit PhnG|nr:phosphonate C-P lyase system protein PhnG [Chloroflexota bacterium]
MFRSFDLPTDSVDQGELLSLLSYADPEEVKAFAAEIAESLGTLEIVSKRTALARLPIVGLDGRQETFEALVTEVCVHASNGAEGYGMCIGTDEDHATAIAVLDVALAADSVGLLTGKINAFLQAQAALLAQAG